jgi:hypothetical protein
MNEYWESVVKPLLDAAGPAVVVEVGAWRGENTRNLLEWAAPREACVHAIDPWPDFDVAALEREHPDTLFFHRERSLSALARIEGIDAVLIDGDHNWYTVVNELRILDRGSRAGRFPLTLLHDVGWPYGRRDLYYDPAAVPDAHRQPYRRGGLVPEGSEPEEGEGLNRHLDHGIYENAVRNGVLTAIEDFLAETESKLVMHQVPGRHGLAILVASARARQGPLAAALKHLRSGAFLEQHCRRLEHDRLSTLIGAAETQRGLAQAQREALSLRSEREALERCLQQAEAESSQLKDRLAELESEQEESSSS